MPVSMAKPRHSIWSTGILNSIAIGTRVVSAFVLNKVLAVTVGPTGYAVIGQFQNVFGLLSAFTANAFGNGVVKYTAQHEGNIVVQRRIWATSVGLTFLLSVAVGVVVIFGHERISSALVGSSLLGAALIVLSFTNFAAACNALLQALLSGKRDLPRFVISVMLGSIGAATATGAAAAAYGIKGALFGVALSPLVGLGSTIVVCWHADWFTLRNLFAKPERGWSGRLIGFGAMSATSAVLLASSQLAVRSAVSIYESHASAGMIQALWKISELYLTFFGSTLSIYLLPRISKQDPATTRAEIKKCLIGLVLFSSAITVLVQLTKSFVIPILFSRDFLPMSDYIGLQFIGDTIRVAGVTLAYAMLGRAMTRSYIFAETTYFLLYTGIAILMLRSIGFVGAIYAYIVTSFIYVIIASILLWKNNEGAFLQNGNG